MAIRIDEVTSWRLSDEQEVIISGSGKYVGNLELKFARACLDNLIDALLRAKNALEPSVNAGPAPSDTVVPAPRAMVAPTAIRMKSDSKSRRTSP